MGQADLIVLAAVNDPSTVSIRWSPTMQEFMDRATERGLSMPVTDDEELREAAQTLNNLSKCIKLVDEAVTEARRPILAYAEGVSKQGVQLKTLAVRAKGDLAARIQSYNEAREAERQAQIAAQRRAQEEAERQKRELERQAQLDREKAERLKWEAEERERLAALAAEGERTPAAVEQVAQQLDLAAQSQRQAEEAEQAARESERLAQVVAPVNVDVADQLGKVKGLKTKKVITIHSTDLKLLPLAYHQVNEKLLMKHLAEGVQIPGVTFTGVDILVGTGR